MPEYLRSARFACGTLTLLLGLSFLVGALMLTGYEVVDLPYYLAVGAALGVCGIVLALFGWIGFMLYGVVTAAAIGWTLFRFGLNLWQLPPHLFALLLWGGILFVLRDRITRRWHPVGPLVRAGLPPHAENASSPRQSA